MKDEDPLPLWLESIPDREPWRRGRDAVVFISLLLLLGQAALITWSIFLGNLGIFVCAVVAGLVALLLLYFIWIGHNWPRWLIAPFYACAGFADAIWGIIYGDGFLFLVGLFGLTIFAYLALAPSVYAFARHQRECIQRSESLIVGGIFLLVIASIGSGLYGFYVYDTDLQRAATDFAGTAFNKVFLYHDEEFLQANLKDEERAMTFHQFVEKISDSLGPVKWVGKFRGVFTTKWAQRRLTIGGVFQVPILVHEAEPIWVNLQVSQIGDGWQIDHIGWEFQPGNFGARP